MTLPGSVPGPGWRLAVDPPDEITSLSAAELAALVANRELAVVDVAEAYLTRIDILNPSINAIVSPVDPELVLEQARGLDAQSDRRGPLHGLPIAVKDLEDVAGLPTRLGSVTTGDAPAEADGLVAERLRSAGALIVGKTNTPEFGTGSHTFNDVFGTTRNPWNLDRSAGGSSGGAAAALASHLLPVADGSDLGGSLRNPAAFCGVIGLRPTLGRVPDVIERSSHLLRSAVRGPMGRSIDDVALALSALAGPHRGDPLSLPESGGTFSPVASHEGALRVGWAGDLGAFVCEPQILAACQAFLDGLSTRDNLIAVEPIEPDFGDAMKIFRVLRGVGYRGLGADLGAELDRCKATVRENVAYGRSLTVDDVLWAEGGRARLHHEMVRTFGDVDVVALPTTQVLPFPVELEYPTKIAGAEQDDYLEWMSSCCVITPTGCPALSLPIGMVNGLPVGLQLVAPIGADAPLLSIAKRLESIAAG